MKQKLSAMRLLSALAWLVVPVLPVNGQPPAPAPLPAPFPIAAPPRPVGLPSPPLPATQPMGAPLVVRVYSLKFASPERIANTLSQVVGGGPIRMRFVANPVTHSVVVSGPEDQFKTVEALLEELDRPDASQGPVQIFRLKNTRADAIADILNKFAQAGTIAVDRSSNSLLASGDPAMLVQLGQIVESLDQAVQGQPQTSRQVRFVWLVSDMNLPAPPADLKDVLEELKAIGVTDLGMAAQNVVQAVSSGKFTVNSTPATFSNCRINISGSLQEKPGETPRLELSLSAKGIIPTEQPEQSSPPAPGPPRPMPPMVPPSILELTSIETTLTAPPGHKVVLGVTPIGKHTSVFVVQILGSGGPEKQAK